MHILPNSLLEAMVKEMDHSGDVLKPIMKKYNFKKCFIEEFESDCI